MSDRMISAGIRGDFPLEREGAPGRTGFTRTLSHQL